MALPPPKPSRLGQQPPPDDAPKSRREKDPLDLEARAIEEELEALRARYDQYFLGIERREPARWRDEIRKKVMRLKGEFTRNTGLRFRIQTLHARYLSYERLWLRSAREKEEGTYRRDLFKARLHRRGAESGAEKAGEAAAAAPEAPKAEEPAKAAPARKVAGAREASTTAPAAAAKPGEAPAPAIPARSPPPLPAAAAKAAAPPPPPRPAVSAGGMDEAQLRALYNAYLAAKMTCREDVSKLTYDAVVRTVTKQIPELMARYKAKSVDFKVEVKGGKAILKAIPKV